MHTEVISRARGKPRLSVVVLFLPGAGCADIQEDKGEIRDAPKNEPWFLIFLFILMDHDDDVI